MILAQEDIVANAKLIGAENGSSKSAPEDKGPPKATVARRAQSYTDFHYAARAVLKENRKEKERKGIQNELDFADWYGGLENDLLEASHDQYK